MSNNRSDTQPTWKDRYTAAHRARQQQYAPAVVRDHGYLSAKYPDVHTANGLTRFVVNYLNWSGHNATRITVTGRMIGKPGQQRYVPGTTRRGRADIDSTILIRPGLGIPVKWEIKVGKDAPSEYQLAEQKRERSAGGYYFFIHNPEEFFDHLDEVLNIVIS